VGGHEDLSAAPCVVAELVPQLVKELRIELILGLLDRKQRVRFRIVEQQQVGEHLDRAIRDVARDERVLEAAVLEAQHQTAVLGGLGLHAVHPRDALAHGLKHPLEAVRVMLVEILGHLRDVVSLVSRNRR